MSTLQKYRKVTPTFARVLTEEDFSRFGGRVRTPEGDASFLPGDFLAHDAKGEWPITNANIRGNFEWTGERESKHSRFYRYMPLNIREACQMSEPFEVNGLTGKAGGYLVRSGKDEWNKWVVDREIFESSYELAEEQTHADH